MRNWAFEPSFGYIIHKGEIDNTFPHGTPDAARFEQEHQLLGSRDLIRTTFALENVVTDHAALQIYYEHMSHGQFLDRGRNQGLDDVGMRFNPDPPR